MIRIAPHDIRHLAVHIVRCERTVRRVYAGRGNDMSRRAVAKGARELGLPPPPNPKTQRETP